MRTATVSETRMAILKILYRGWEYAGDGSPSGGILIAVGQISEFLLEDLRTMGCELSEQVFQGSWNSLIRDGYAEIKGPDDDVPIQGSRITMRGREYLAAQNSVETRTIQIISGGVTMENVISGSNITGSVLVVPH